MRTQKGLTTVEITIAILTIGVLLGWLFILLSSSYNGISQIPDPGQSESGPIHALHGYGFTDATLGGIPPFNKCGEGDDPFSSRTFEATNVAGVRVSGFVCCGFLKGCTVRF